MVNITGHQGTADQNNREGSPHTREGDYDQEDNKGWGELGEFVTLIRYWWECKMVRPLCLAVFLKS